MGCTEDAQALLMRRGIYPGEECPKCQGVGVRAYSSTATWRDGVGGNAITNDVCDACWGSGKRHSPWPSHRDYQSVKQLQAELAASRAQSNELAVCLENVLSRWEPVTQGGRGCEEGCREAIEAFRQQAKGD